jgi:hypothetical protein
VSRGGGLISVSMRERSRFLGGMTVRVGFTQT